MATLKDEIEKILIDCDRVHLPGGRWFDTKEAVDRIMNEIDKEQKILRPALRWFAEEMEKDLKKNDFKGGWLDDELGYYRRKALKHLIALEDIDSMKFMKINSKKKAIAHCIKSANYSMMLAQNLIEELKENVDV